MEGGVGAKGGLHADSHTRLLDVWYQAIIRCDVADGTARVRAEELAEERSEDDLMQAILPLHALQAAIADNEWMCSSFDFSSVTGSDSEEMVWDAFLDGYQGKWILDALDVTARMLNPDDVPLDQLCDEGATLSPPADCPVSALRPETLPRFLADLGSETMRLRLMAEEVIAVAYAGPHLSAVEARTPGIFYQGHALLGLHQYIADLFGDSECPWDIGNVAPLNLEFANGLDIVTRHAKAVGLEAEAHRFVDESMVEYANYHRPQWLEWVENPVFRVGSLGSPEHSSRCEDHGVWHARYLVAEGHVELIFAVARYVHATAEAVTECLNGDAYGGPLKLLVDETLWAQLVAFSQQEARLWECEGVDELRTLVYKHYKGLFLSNVWCEELVKEFKNLSHQARAHAASAEIRILHHQRRVLGRRFFGLPSRERLQTIRRKLKHHLRRRARPKRLPPAEPLPPIVWAGHDGT